MRPICHCTEASKQLEPAFAAMDAVRETEKPTEAPEETAPAPGTCAQGHGQEIDRRQSGTGGPNLPGPDIHPLPQAKNQEDSDEQGQ